MRIIMKGISSKGLSSLLFIVSVLLTVQLKANPQNLTLEDFLEEPSLRDVEISPDGRYLATVWNFETKRQVVIRDLNDPKYPIVGTIGDNVIRPTSVSWANNERLLVNLLVPYNTKNVIEKSKEEEDFDIRKFYMAGRTIAMNVDATEAVQLMGDQKRLHRSNRNLSRIKNFLPDDPKHVLMPAYKKGRRELYKVNVYTGKSERIARGGKRTYAFLSDEKGRPQYRFDFLRISRAIVIYEYDEDEDWIEVERIDLEQELEDDFDGRRLIGLYEENKLVYRRRNEETGYYELIVKNKGEEKTKVLASLPKQDILGVIVSRRTDKILGYATEKDYIRNHYFNPESQESYDNLVKQIGNNNFYFTGGGRGSKRAVVMSYGPDNPGTYFLYNSDKEKLTFLQDRYSKLKPEALSVPALVKYKARDSQLIRAYILLPKDFEGNLPLPTVVLPHGGPQARDRADYDDFAQYISSKGYIVIKPNFRGSTGYGKEFEEAGYGEWGGLMQDDVTDAAKFLVESGYADPEKICIAGISYGGYSALMGAIKTPDLYQCAISIAGVTHLTEQIEFDIDSYKGTNQDKFAAYVYKTIGEPDKDEKKLDKNSPALHADKISIPVMIIAGDKDRVVPLDQAELMVEALEDAKKEFEYIELEDTGHNVFRYIEDTEVVYKEVGEFLDKHLAASKPKAKKVSKN